MRRRPDRLTEPAAIHTPALYFERDMSGVETGRFAGGDIVFVTVRCPSKDTPNEDAMAFIPTSESSGVLAIADGVGGRPSGEQAARIALVALKDALEGADRTGEGWMRDAILNGIESANRAVLELEGGATTLAVAEISARSIRSYHVGDSLVLVTGLRGRVKHEAVPHSPVGYALHAGLIEEDEAMVHEDRNLIYNVIGASDMRIEIGPTVELAAYDTLLIASDGLSDNLYPREIVELMRKGRLEEAGARLFSTCVERMKSPDAEHPSKPDDLTFVVFRPPHAVT